MFKKLWFLITGLSAKISGQNKKEPYVPLQDLFDLELVDFFKEGETSVLWKELGIRAKEFSHLANYADLCNLKDFPEKIPAEWQGFTIVCPYMVPLYGCGIGYPCLHYQHNQWMKSWNWAGKGYESPLDSSCRFLKLNPLQKA